MAQGGYLASIKSAADLALIEALLNAK
jgi:hypothetical protein